MKRACDGLLEPLDDIIELDDILRARAVVFARLVIDKLERDDVNGRNSSIRADVALPSSARDRRRSEEGEKNRRNLVAREGFLDRRTMIPELAVSVHSVTE